MKAGTCPLLNSAGRCIPTPDQTKVAAGPNPCRRMARTAVWIDSGVGPCSHTMTSASARMADTS